MGGEGEGEGPAEVPEFVWKIDCLPIRTKMRVKYKTKIRVVVVLVVVVVFLFQIDGPKQFRHNGVFLHPWYCGLQFFSKRMFMEVFRWSFHSVACAFDPLRHGCIC